MKLNSYYYYPEPISAWAFIEGAIPDIGTSGVTFARISPTVVQVNKTAHGLQNGWFVTFDALTGTQSYLNGTWTISSRADNSFQFTISGATVPTGTLTVANGMPTRIRKSYNVSKVGRIANGRYIIYFSNAMDDSDFIAIGNAVYNNPANYYHPDNWNNPEFLDMNVGVGMIAQSASSITMQTTYINGLNYNVKDLHVAVIGGIN
jgi:hypothetical protein